MKWRRNWKGNRLKAEGKIRYEFFGIRNSRCLDNARSRVNLPRIKRQVYDSDSDDYMDVEEDELQYAERLESDKKLLAEVAAEQVQGHLHDEQAAASLVITRVF